MQIILDDEKHFALISNPKTLGDVLVEITNHIQSEKRAIQVILIDGENIAPEALTVQVGQRAVADVQTIEIQTADLMTLVVTALDEIAAVIPELPSACHELAQILAGDSPASCFAQFNQLLEIWEVLKERQAQVIELLDIDTASTIVGKTTIAAHDAALDVIIQNARKFMEASKFPALSDLLSHELAELAGIEEEIIERLKATP